MRKVVAQMREHVKSVSLSVQEAHVISGVDADSVLGSEEVRKTRTRPAAKNPEAMMGTIQWISGPLVQANQKRPMGRRQAPIMEGGRRASGGAKPPWAAETLR